MCIRDSPGTVDEYGNIVDGDDVIIEYYDLDGMPVTYTRKLPGRGTVLALNCLVNSTMLTPCCPSAGPTGGAGVALPAGICNLIYPSTCLLYTSRCV